MSTLVKTDPYVQEMRGKILELEAKMLASPPSPDGVQPGQVFIEPVHRFAPGLYLREITIPAGVTITGAIHRTEHYCFLLKGEVGVWTDEGMKRLKAPAVVHSLPGIKRVLHAMEEAVWVNVHANPTNERDLDKIDEIYTAKTFEEVLGFREAKQIEGGN